MGKNKRFCPDCGSPAEGNPCWFFLRREYDTSDPPCYCREYARDQAKRSRRYGVFLFGLFAAFLCAALLLITQ